MTKEERQGHNITRKTFYIFRHDVVQSFFYTVIMKKQTQVGFDDVRVEKMVH